MHSSVAPELVGAESRERAASALAALRDSAIRVDAALSAELDAAGRRFDLPPSLGGAIAYGVLGGGKRLRPSLCLLSCAAVGGTEEDALPAAVAIELVHCFSLVHDDLPAMDDDDLRRGRPTLHVKAGEALAILAGDAMLPMAFDLLAGAAQLRPEHRLRLIQELTSDTALMIGGQVYDTLGGFPPELSDEGRLRLIHHMKTAALLRCACRMGGICGGATADHLDALTAYGEAIGLMFQIVDDLLDVTQSTEHIGKAAGKDESAGKLTFPGLLGLEPSRQEVGRLCRQAHDALQPLGKPAQRLRDVCDYLAVRTR